MQRSKYQLLSIKRKLEIIDAVEKAPAGRKRKKLPLNLESQLTPSGILKKKGELNKSKSYGRNSKKTQ